MLILLAFQEHLIRPCYNMLASATQYVKKSYYSVYINFEATMLKFVVVELNFYDEEGQCCFGNFISKGLL